MRSGLMLVVLLLNFAPRLIGAEGDGAAIAVDATNLPVVQKCKQTAIDGSEPDKLRHFEVFVEALPNQELKDGIRLNITVHNKLAEAVVLENPVDYFTYTLRNSAGAEVALPRPPPRAERQSLKESREPRKLAFTLTGMTLDGQKLDAAAIDQDTLKIPAEGKLSFGVLIDKQAPGPRGKPEELRIGALEAGRYVLKLRTAILLHHEDGSAWFDTPPYDDVESVSIKLK